MYPTEKLWSTVETEAIQLFNIKGAQFLSNRQAISVRVMWRLLTQVGRGGRGHVFLQDKRVRLLSFFTAHYTGRANDGEWRTRTFHRQCYNRLAHSTHFDALIRTGMKNTHAPSSTLVPADSGTMIGSPVGMGSDLLIKEKCYKLV